MKKLVYIIIILTGIILGFPSCKSQDSLYEEYIIPNRRVYPGKAMNAEAHSGNKRIEIAWQNSSDPKVVKARISWNNYTLWEDIDIDPSKNVISKIIDPLDENTYSFMIRTYDDEGNISVPVEVIGTAYGALYQSTLVNRTLKNAFYNAETGSLEVEWYGAEDTEVFIEVEYTDTDNKPQTWTVKNGATTTVIPDFKLGEKVAYTTSFRPDSAAIDVFSAPKTPFVYSADPVNISSKLAGRSSAPFERTEPMIDDNWYATTYWKTNYDMRANGNVHNAALNDVIGCLGWWTWDGYAVVPKIENGKMWQSVELDAGTYRFEATYRYNSRVDHKSYVVAALGENYLPDTNNVETEYRQQVLDYVVIPPSPTGRVNTLLRVTFVLTEKSTVTLGFVTTTTGLNNTVAFSKIELWQDFNF